MQDWLGTEASLSYLPFGTITVSEKEEELLWSMSWDRGNNRGKMQATFGLHFYVKNRKMVPKNRPSMV